MQVVRATMSPEEILTADIPETLKGDIMCGGIEPPYSEYVPSH